MALCICLYVTDTSFFCLKALLYYYVYASCIMELKHFLQMVLLLIEFILKCYFQPTYLS